MSRVSCPHCDAVLPPQQLADGWCDACGKKIPNHALAATTRASARPRGVGGEEATLPGTTGRPTVAGYLVIFLFVAIGAVFTVALENGKANWVWLGCGIGAGVGVGAAQAFGLWPSRRG